MSSGSYLQVDVKCPFYKSDDGQHRIVCEGFVDDCTLSQTYKKKNDFLQQIRIFCSEHYPKCEAYRLLMAKYEDDMA